MGKCPNCGYKEWLLITRKCKICDKKGCDKCFIWLLEIELDTHKESWEWYVCSNQCFENFASKIAEQASPEDIDISAPEESIFNLFVKRVILNPDNKKWLSHGLAKRIAEGKRFVVDFGPTGNELWKRLQRYALLISAKNLEKARRFEEAAQIYEQFRMYEEAGRLRDKSEEIKVRRTEVSIDLNKLLQQAKDGGLVLVYRCPHCGGNIKIGKDTKAESLRSCYYCGSRIETVDLTEFLKFALS